MTICPVCGSKEWIKRYRIDSWTIEECNTCGFAHIDPMPVREDRAGCYSEEKVVERNVKEKNSLQKFSRLLKKLFSKATKRDKSAIFYNKLRRHLQPKSKVLDIGCGDGSFIRKAKEDFVCTGIEISDYLASLARKRPGIKVITGNFLDTEFNSEEYDGVTLISLLEHLDDPLQAIKKCFEFLKQGGVLLMKTVNYNCFNRRIKKDLWTGFRPPDHVIYFNPSNLELLLKKVGFKKIKISAMPFNDNM
ncbi:MAG: class I SAM-dependent methyltransferase, partial [Candidatus Omnitrophica bacterium]|nr:class I SAM-dependent methyltransferase [Candidatus Omnitrophota bacterium]